MTQNPLSSAEVEALKLQFHKQKHRIKNPGGWLRQALSGSWNFGWYADKIKQKQVDREKQKQIEITQKNLWEQESLESRRQEEQELLSFKEMYPEKFNEYHEIADRYCRSTKGYQPTDELYDVFYQFKLKQLIKNY